MPAVIARSISILSDAGLGMAMFSLGIRLDSFLSLSLQCSSLVCFFLLSSDLLSAQIFLVKMQVFF